MKRKVVQQGPATLMVSLPSKWAKKFNIKKGDELELEEHERQLVLTSSKEMFIERRDLHMKADHPAAIRRQITAQYLQGVDELEVTLDDPKKLKLVQDSLDYCIGYEIVDQGNKNCLIKNIATGIETDIDQIVRRAFLLIVTIAKHHYNALKNSNFELLKELRNLEDTVNKLTLFIQRLLLKRGYVDYKKTTFIFSIVSDLERLSDEFNRLARYLLQSGKSKIVLHKDTLEICRQLVEFIENVHHFYYHFSEQNYVDIRKKRKSLIEECYEKLKAKPVLDAILIHHVISIGLMCFEINKTILALRL